VPKPVGDSRWLQVYAASPAVDRTKAQRFGLAVAKTKQQGVQRDSSVFSALRLDRASWVAGRWPRTRSAAAGGTDGAPRALARSARWLDERERTLSGRRPAHRRSVRGRPGRTAPRSRGIKFEVVAVGEGPGGPGARGGRLGRVRPTGRIRCAAQYPASVARDPSGRLKGERRDRRAPDWSWRFGRCAQRLRDACSLQGTGPSVTPRQRAEKNRTS